MDNGATVRPAWGPREYTIATVGLLVGVVLLYVVLQFVGGAAGSGDEPPITVKHGSIKLELVSSKNNVKWKPKGGSSTAWEFGEKNPQGNSFEHHSDKYDVYIGMAPATANGKCAGGTFIQASTVTIVYSDQAWATIGLNGKKTTITTSTPFSNTAAPTELDYGTQSGYITKLVIDSDQNGTPYCTFDDHQLLGIALLDSN